MIECPAACSIEIEYFFGKDGFVWVTAYPVDEVRAEGHTARTDPMTAKTLNRRLAVGECGDGFETDRPGGVAAE